MLSKNLQNILVNNINTTGTSGNLQLTNITVTNLIASNINLPSINTTNINTTNLTTTNLTTINFTTSNFASSNFVSSNITTNNLLITLGSLISVGNSNTLGSLFTTGGNVGIATTVPSQTLDVNGNINFSGSLYKGGSLYTSSQWTGTAGTSIFYLGNVGIGTTNPSYSIDILNTTPNSSLPFIRLSNSGGGPGNQVGIYLVPSSTRTGGPPTFVSAIDDGSAGAHLIFGTNINGTSGSTERVRIQSVTGNVGIGTTSPSFTLDVSGTTRITTSITTGLLNCTNITSTNLVTTNFTTSNLVISNLNVSNLTIGNNIVTNSLLKIYQGTVASLFITTSGNVYVGDSTTSGVDNIAFGFDAISNGYRLGFVKKTALNPTLAISNNSQFILSVANSNDITTVSSNTYTALLTINTNGNGILSGGLTVGNINSTGITTASLFASNSVQTNLTTSTLNVTSTAIITNLQGTTFTQNTNDSLFIGNSSQPNFFIDRTAGSVFVGWNTAKPSIADNIWHFVNNSTDRTTLLQLQSAGVSSGNNLVRSVVNCGFLNNSNTLGNIITTGGNVGINTVSPGATLDVSGSGRFTTFVTTGTLNATNITSTNAVFTNATISSLIAIGNSNTLGSLFTTGGNVGIQTTSPNSSYQLHVNGNTLVSGGLLVNNNTTIYGINDNMSLSFDANSSNLYRFGFVKKAGATPGIAFSNTIPFNIYVSSTNNIDTVVTNTYASLLTIQTNGNVGISQTNPGNTLDVSGSGRFTTFITTGTLNATNCTITNAVHTSITTASLYMTGDARIAGGLKLDGSLAGSFTVGPGNYNFTNSGTAWQGPNGATFTAGNLWTIHASGRIAATEFWCISDIRTKKNDVLLESSNSLEIINKLRPKEYEYKDFINKGNKKRLGFIAQELEEILPNAINVDTSGQFIPNIYKVYETNNNKLHLNCENLDFKCGTRLKCITRDQIEIIVTVESVNNDVALILENIFEKDIFVYGSEVFDFKTVDYNDTLMVSISAIQELDKKIEDLKKLLKL